MLACKFVCQSILQGDTAVRTVKGKIMALWQKMRRSETDAWRPMNGTDEVGCQIQHTQIRVTRQNKSHTRAFVTFASLINHTFSTNK